MKRKYTVLGAGVLVLAFIAWLLVESAPAGFVVMLPALTHTQLSQYVILIVLGISELALLLPLVIYMIVTKTSVLALLGNRTGWQQNVLAALFGILLAPALAGVSTVFSELFIMMGATIPDTSMYEPKTLGTLLVGMVCVGVFAGVAEEPIFRGVVMRGFAGRFNKHAAIMITALVFSMIHMDIVGAPTRFIIGLALGYMAWRSGAILPGVITHAAYNSCAIAMGLFLTTAFPHWTSFHLIPGASEAVDSMLTWVIISIPFAAAAWGVYVLYDRYAPANAAWRAQPYAVSETKPVHWLAWAGVGVIVLGLTALTALAMWLPSLMGMSGLPGFGQ